MKLIKKGVLSGIIFAITLLMTACSKYKVKDEQVRTEGSVSGL